MYKICNFTRFYFTNGEQIQIYCIVAAVNRQFSFLLPKPSEEEGNARLY